jgi:hypothetical protein
VMGAGIQPLHGVACNVKYWFSVQGLGFQVQSAGFKAHEIGDPL